MPQSTTCEVTEAGKPKIVNVADALGLKDSQSDFRCIECHQLVRPHRRGKNGMAPHFEHLVWNANCPLRQKRPA